MALSDLISKLPSIHNRTPHASTGESCEFRRNNVYILPTRQGLVFSLMLIVMLLAAINYNNNMTFALTFALVALAIISMFHTYANLLNIKVLARSNQGCFAGENALFHLQLSHSDSTTKIQISTEIADKNERADAPNDIYTISIAPQTSSTVEVIKPSVHRGRLSLGRTVFSSHYPLGLFRAWTYVEINSDVIIYPQPSTDTPSLPFDQSEGDRIDTPESGSDDFHGLRAYHQGDSPRHIHWKSWAQGKDELVTKQFNRKKSPELWLDWDYVQHPDPESRLEILCRWVLEANVRDQNYGLILPGTRIAPGKGDIHRHQCLKALALYGQAA